MERAGRVAGVFAVLATLAASGCDGGTSTAPAGSPTSPAGSESGSSAGQTVAPAEPTPTGPPLLLPDMRSLDATQLRIQRTGEGRRLRFSAALANIGPGPMLLKPTRGDVCPPGQHPARQLVHEDRNEDGVFQRRRDRVSESRRVGCMLRHPGHDHWHFDAMARYALRRPGAEAPLVARDKVSFCLRDNARVPRHPVTVRREHFGECTRNRVQGISPGWVDIYKWDLDGQWLALPRGVDGDLLCLDLEADPYDQLRESDETGNGTSIAIRVNGERVRKVRSGSCST